MILVGFCDNFVANLVDLDCGNGGLWTMEVAVGRNEVAFWVCLSFFRISNERGRDK